MNVFMSEYDDKIVDFWFFGSTTISAMTVFLSITSVFLLASAATLLVVEGTCEVKSTETLHHESLPLLTQ